MPHNEHVPAGLELRVLGELQVLGPDGPVEFGAAKERCLLAALAAAGDVPVSRDGLVEALWAGCAPRSAVNAVQNYVLRVRRSLQVTGLRIVTGPGGYRLDAAPGSVDAGLAERLIARGRAALAAGDRVAGAEALRSALGLWRGPSFGEFADRGFAALESRRLDELRACAQEDLADAELAAGRHCELVAELERMVAEAPLRERRWGQLVLALYRSGRQADALSALRRLRRTLADELGVDPSPELLDLQDRILRHDAGLDRPAERAVAAAAAELVGRDAELGRLLDRHARAAAGHGGVVTLAGEAGIGKTTVLRALAAAVAARGGLVLAGRCVEGEWQPAYHAFVEAVAEQVGALDAQGLAVLGPVAELVARSSPRLHHLTARLPSSPRLPPDEEHLRLLDGLARFVLAGTERAPVLLLLDDMHWADPSTLRLLRHLARSASDARLLVVLAYRDTEAAPALLDVLGALHTEVETSTLHLSGLTGTPMRQLLSAAVCGPVASRLAETIRAQTRGNPFLAREVIRHLAEEDALRPGPDGELHTDVTLSGIPDGVRRVLARRRARLSGAANRLLDHAAAVDGPFLFGAVTQAAGLADEPALAALDEIIDAGLVQPDATTERYVFRHALIQQAVLVDLNPSRRVRVHRHLAEALATARTRVRGVTAAEVAAQFHASATLPGAAAGVPYALEAAGVTESAAAHDETADLLAMACALAAPGDERLPDMLARRGLALCWALRFDEAVTVACDAAARLAQARDAPAAATYLADVTVALAGADDAPHAWRTAELGLRYAGARRDRAWASLVLHDLDRREAAEPDFPGMMLDHPQRREAVRILLDSGEVASRPDLARFAVAAAFGHRDRIPAGVADDPSTRLFVLGDYAGAVPLFQAAATAARERGRIALEGYHRTVGARAHLALGDLDAGRTLIAQGRHILDRTGQGSWGWQRIQTVGSLDCLAHVTDVGWTEVLARLDEAFGPDNPAGRRLEASGRACGAKAAARLGRPDEALGLVAAALPAIQRAPAWAMNYLRTLCDAVEALWLVLDPATGGHEHVAALERAVREKALPADFRFPMMDARLALARLCALDGRHDEAREWFARAREVLDAQQARPLRAITDLDEARVASMAGDVEGGRVLLATATEAFTRLGMTGWIRRARQLGAPPVISALLRGGVDPQDPRGAGRARAR